MSNAIQLNLWDWLEEASIVAEQVPELVAISDGVAALDSVIEAIAHELIPAQLSVAAEAFAQLSAILECKSERWSSGCSLILQHKPCCLFKNGRKASPSLNLLKSHQ